MIFQQQRRLTELEQQIVSMEEGFSREKEELIGLRNFVFKFGQNDLEGEQEGEIGIIWQQKERFPEKKILVVGGTENWRKKMRRLLPDSQFYPTDRNNFHPGILRRKKYIVIHTDSLSPGLYHQILSRKTKEQKIVYVHGNNVEMTIRQIQGQI